MAGAERRLHPRVQISVEVGFESAHYFYCGRTRDVSAGGLFIDTEVGLPVGTEVTVDLRIPGMHAALRSEVVWALVGKDGRSVGFGVRFLSVPAAVEHKLRAFMEAHGAAGVVVTEPEDVEPPQGGPPPLPRG